MKSHTLDAYTAISITLFAATVALGLRLVARRMTTFGYGWEDCLAVLAWARLPFFYSIPPCALFARNRVLI